MQDRIKNIPSRVLLIVVFCLSSAIWLAFESKQAITPILFGGTAFQTLSPLAQTGIVALISIGLFPLLYGFLNYIFPEDSVQKWRDCLNQNVIRTSLYSNKPRTIQAFDEVWLPFVVSTAYFSVIFFTIMEWIFFITKASFMDSLTFMEKILILFQTEWAITLPMFVMALIFVAMEGLRFTWVKRPSRILLNLWTAFFISLTVLLLVDNFTYTLTAFGIVKSTVGMRVIYLVVFLLFFAETYRRINYYFRTVGNPRKSFLLAGILFSLSTLAVVLGFFTRSEYSRGVTPNGPLRTPNIVMVGTDALDASHLSFYGYNRDTTPFINSMLDSALVMQNHFSNANNSAGSVGSIFNSKLPTRTKVAKHPDAFNGKDAYEHLPGILMDLGYRNYEITYAIYEDAVNLNIKRGFHKASGVNLEQNLLSLIYGKFLPDPAQFFIDELTERARDRLLHITFIRKMADPFAAINEPTYDDSLIRMPELLRVISESRQPYFIHAHLLGTHGPTYAPSSDAYSSGDLQTDDWMPDFYDDAIRDFDGYIKVIFAALAQSGQLDNTVVILYTDHARTRDSLEKIPSVIWFPKQEYTGKVLENTNNLDLSPTILDYIGLQKPGWMEGSSMISGDLDRYRPIYGAIWRRPRTPGGKPPYFEFGNFRVTICQKYVDYSTIPGKWTWGYIRNYADPCPLESLPTLEEMQDILIDRIAGDGYDPIVMDQNRR